MVKRTNQIQIQIDPRVSNHNRSTNYKCPQVTRAGRGEPRGRRMNNLLALPLGHGNTMRTNTQVIRISIAKVDKLVLDCLRDLRPLDDAIYWVLGCEYIVDVGAVHCALDIGLERWLDLFREEFLPVDYISGRGKGVRIGQQYCKATERKGKGTYCF
jgi:hypothetical protein